MGACCLDISDVELQFNRRIGYDVIFDLTNFNPSEGDFYTVLDDIATLVNGPASIVYLTDASGNILTDASGNKLTVNP